MRALTPRALSHLRRGWTWRSTAVNYSASNKSGFTGSCVRLTPFAAEQLERHAREILDRHIVTGEPLAWSPPSIWADVHGLPGLGPDDIDPEEVSRLLRNGRSVTTVATLLGTTTVHIRLIVRRHPLGVRPRERFSLSVIEQKLAPDALRRLIVEERRSVKSVAARYGVSHKTLRRLMQRHDIVCPKTRYLSTRLGLENNMWDDAAASLKLPRNSASRYRSWQPLPADTRSRVEQERLPLRQVSRPQWARRNHLQAPYRDSATLSGCVASRCVPEHDL